MAHSLTGARVTVPTDQLSIYGAAVSSLAVPSPVSPYLTANTPTTAHSPTTPVGAASSSASVLALYTAYA